VLALIVLRCCRTGITAPTVALKPHQIGDGGADRRRGLAGYAALRLIGQQRAR